MSVEHWQSTVSDFVAVHIQMPNWLKSFDASNGLMTNDISMQGEAGPESEYNYKSLSFTSTPLWHVSGH